MIRGVVNPDLEATIPVAVLDAQGQSQPVEAVIDTGYNGFLTMPPALIASLQLPWLCRQQGMLADGSIQIFDVYVAPILWDGQTRVVEAEAVDAQPLVGMELLRGHDLQIRVLNGGDVTIGVVP